MQARRQWLRAIHAAPRLVSTPDTLNMDEQVLQLLQFSETCRTYEDKQAL